MFINDVKINPGETVDTKLSVAKLYDYTDVKVPVRVIRGKKDGPTLFVCAALHGDEINGVEIIRRLLGHKSLKRIKGTLIAIPIVNVFGFNAKSRYLPDRRDLNRCFPGSKTGSLGGLLAHLFVEEIVKKADFGIDLHTGAIHRTNLPQIRAVLKHEKIQELASAFGAPVVLDSTLRPGTLREAALEHDVPLLVYEAGEALYFDETCIRTGVRGILSVMRKIGMLPQLSKAKPKPVFEAHSSHWIRAPHSGIIQVKKSLGKGVLKNEVLGIISDPLGKHQSVIKARHSGVLIGLNRLPLLNKGDAVFHIATFEDHEAVAEHIENSDEFVGNEDTFVDNRID